MKKGTVLKLFSTVLLVGGVAGAGAWIALNYHKPVVAPEIEQAVKINAYTVELTNDALANVTIDKAKMVEVPDVLSVTGRVSVTEDRTTVVPARVTGRTDSVFVASGEAVKKGQPLLELFSPDFVAAREEYLQSLRLGLGTKPGEPNSDFSEMAKLAKKKLMTLGLNEQDINRLSEKDAKEGNLLVRAPRDGIIMIKNAIIGNLVNVGDTLFTIGDISKVWFTGDLYPEDLLKVKVGQHVDIDAIGDERPSGTVSFISPMIDPNARTIKIRALMDNPKLLLKADMYIQGNLILEQKMRLLIPSRALTRMKNTYSVFKRVSGSNRFEKVQVKVAFEQGENSVIEAGLWEGDEIVSDGGALLLNATLDSEDAPSVTASK